MTSDVNQPEAPLPDPATGRRRVGFTEDFVRFFFRGLGALLPTLITLYLLIKVWQFLWEGVGRHIIWFIRRSWVALAEAGVVSYDPPGHIARRLSASEWQVELLGVLLAIVLVYIVGLFVGNVLGRAFWRMLERGAMRIPLIKQIYPAVKQVTDLFLAEKGTHAIQSSRVVACQARATGIWAMGFVTGTGLGPLSEAVGDEMVTVFIPSSPTAFAGYVIVVARKDCIELPLTVEQLLRMLMTGGVVAPKLDGLPAGVPLTGGADRPVAAIPAGADAGAAELVAADERRATG